MKFTKEKLLSHSPCADGLSFAESLKFDFAKIYDTCDRGDWLIWLLRKSGNLDKLKAVELAIACAQRVLEIFEKKYPDDKRPRKAIEAALEWLKNPTENNRKSAAAAAATPPTPPPPPPPTPPPPPPPTPPHAAAARRRLRHRRLRRHAAAAAYAADAADAAYAAAAYATASKLKERKWQSEKIREIIPNPFK